MNKTGLLVKIQGASNISKAAYHGRPGVDLSLPVVQGGEGRNDEEGATMA